MNPQTNINQTLPQRKSFLEYVAADLLDKLGDDLSGVAVVFPNKRASLFFNEYLARKAGHPVWSPEYMTISQLFTAHAKRQVADNILLVAELHRAFCRCTGSKETLDRFFGWGQLLLADFDDIDKNMAKADKVLANVTDLHDMDDLSYLTPEQVALLRRFFGCFDEKHPTEMKRRFLTLWKEFYNIYTDFNRSLAEQGLAYEGSLYREVADDPNLQFHKHMYVFVGFNMVQQVEQRIFSRLQQQGKAMFYWDYDFYYMPRKGQPTHEAGHFISAIMEHFPNQLNPHDGAIYDNLIRHKHVTLIQAATEDIQARYVATWLRREQRMEAGRKTAVVLCNEQLLPTVVHCLPKEADKVNITTGYPLSLSPVNSLVNLLVSLQTTGYDRHRSRFKLVYVNRLLRHPYTHYIAPEANRLYARLNVESKVYYPTPEALSADDPDLALLFTPVERPEQETQTPPLWLTHWLMECLRRMASRLPAQGDPFLQETVFRTYTLINRLHGLMASGQLSIGVATLQRLMLLLIRSASIPFHGEPAVGLQVMGVLETRNLDFDHLLLLSCNEGNLPKGVNDNSFIPYSIRKAHGLTTIDHKVAIYAYYFHRLIQRAKDVTIVYNGSTDNGHTGEVSRFVLQLMVESGLHIEKKTLLGGQSPLTFAPSPIPKSPQAVKRLIERFAFTPKSAPQPLLTPTAVNTYMRCGVLFYYTYVLGLRELDEADEESMDRRTFGNIFHEASQMLYERLTRQSNVITATQLKGLLASDAEIMAAIDEAFSRMLFKMDRKDAFKPEYNGLQLINREVIATYIRKLLEIDLHLAPIEIVGLEKDVMEEMEIRCGDRTFTTLLGGRIDRMDRLTDGAGRRIRIIDYKTGTHVATGLESVANIFDRENPHRHAGYYLQTILYSRIVRESPAYNPGNDKVSPALLFIQHTAGDDYDPTVSYGGEKLIDVSVCAEDFMNRLRQVVSDMFDPDLPFMPSYDRSGCRYCPFAKFCGIGDNKV